MTREQMIDVLEDYFNKNICVSCKHHHACESKQVFSDMTDEEMEFYVSDIKEKNTDKESQNECELEEKKMEQVKVLEQIAKITYPEKMKDVLPMREFVKNFLEKGYKVEILTHLASDDLDVVVYKEVEMKE